MTKKEIHIAVSGAGGYGFYYLQEIMEHAADRQVRLKAVFDPRIRSLPVYPRLQTQQVACYDQYADFVQAMKDCDLAVVVSPIHDHARQTVDALMSGCHVLLDKPLAGSVEQAAQILEVEQKSPGRLMIGYQWSYSDAIRKLKEAMISGRFGPVKRAKTLVFWPRDYAYFNRNDWAGRLQTDDGMAINDSLANNAMAHFIHNLLFLAGQEADASARVISGTCELYRAYPIETYDTAVISWLTDQGIPMLFYGSHVTRNSRGPLFMMECERAAIYFGELSNDIVAVFHDGLTQNFGDPDASKQFKKLWVAVDACRGGTDKGVTARAAFGQTCLIDAIARHGEVISFPDNRITNLPGERRYVDGLGYKLLSAYQHGVFPSKLGFDLKGTIKKFTI